MLSLSSIIYHGSTVKCSDGVFVWGLAVNCRNAILLDDTNDIADAAHLKVEQCMRSGSQPDQCVFLRLTQYLYQRVNNI